MRCRPTGGAGGSPLRGPLSLIIARFPVQRRICQGPIFAAGEPLTDSALHRYSSLRERGPGFQGARPLAEFEAAPHARLSALALHVHHSHGLGTTSCLFNSGLAGPLPFRAFPDCFPISSARFSLGRAALLPSALWLDPPERVRCMLIFDWTGAAISVSILPPSKPFGLSDGDLPRPRSHPDLGAGKVAANLLPELFLELSRILLADPS